MNHYKEIDSALHEKINVKIKTIADVADQLPSVIIIQDLKTLSVLYMSKVGLTLLGKSEEEIKSLSGAEYHERFFNPEYAKDSVPKIRAMIENNTDDIVSFFQQVRTSKEKEWDWYLCSTKIFMRDEHNNPILIINSALKVDPNHYFTGKAVRMLEENTFLKNHYTQFGKLTSREKEVLKLLVLGKSAADIGVALNISASTAETHRKNIYHKLNTNNSFELSQYAYAFDLL